MILLNLKANVMKILKLKKIKFFIIIIFLILFITIVDINSSKQNIMYSWFDTVGILYTYNNNIITEKRKIFFLFTKDVKEAKYLIGEVQLYIDRTINYNKYKSQY